MQEWLHAHSSAGFQRDEVELARKLSQIATPAQDLDTFHASLHSPVKSPSSILLLAPTGSGKTLQAISFANAVLEEGLQVWCIAPYHSLLDELLQRMRVAFEPRGFVCGSMDATAKPKHGPRTDIFFGTPEQALKLTLSSTSLSHIGGIILDEAHHAVEHGQRASRLQMLLSILKLEQQSGRTPRLLALTATMERRTALAFCAWLHCTLVCCTSRSLPLHVAAATGQHLQYCPQVLSVPAKPLRRRNGSRAGTDEQDSSSTAVLRQTIRYAVQRVHAGARVLVFTPTRLLCERVAAQMAQQLDQHVVHFHHAGVEHSRRDRVVQAFRSGSSHLLVATTTLAMGVNLPATDVIIFKGTKHQDYEDSLTQARDWSVLQQQAGRAGRWGMQRHGRCIMFGSRGDGSAATGHTRFKHPLGLDQTRGHSSGAVTTVDARCAWRAAELLLVLLLRCGTPRAVAACMAFVRSAYVFALHSTRHCATHFTRGLCILRACDMVDVHHIARATQAPQSDHVRLTLSRAGVAAARALSVCELDDFLGMIQFACGMTPPQVLPLDEVAPHRRIALLTGSAPRGSASEDSAFALAPLRRIGHCFDWHAIRSWLSLLPKTGTS